MPLNGSGAYSLPSPSFPAVPNTLITASDFNTTLSDIAGALSQCVFRDGQAAFTASQSMGNRKLTSLAAGTADTDAVNKGQLLTLFPIGAVYITAGNTNPGTFLGGTWSQIAQGRTLIGVGTLGTDTYAAGAEGGAARVTLTTTEMPWHNHGSATSSQSATHTHNFSAGTSTDGAHVHRLINMGFDGSTGSYVDYATSAGATSGYDAMESAGSHAHSVSGVTLTENGFHTHAVSGEGGGAAHENRMPYLAVYFWQRTA